MADITELLNKWHAGDRDAFDELVPQAPTVEERSVILDLFRR